jgi:hypothetical protein
MLVMLIKREAAADLLAPPRGQPGAVPRFLLETVHPVLRNSNARRVLFLWSACRVEVVEPMSRPAWRDRRKNFRLGWHLPATIYDAGRHLERPCIVVDISNGGEDCGGQSTHDPRRVRVAHAHRRPSIVPGYLAHRGYAGRRVH